ncbi:MAG TPA: hypothetical protein VGP07_13560 [Polyangia bacterium]|jgi:hypothetical protein
MTTEIGTAIIIATRTVVACEYKGQTWKMPEGVTDANIFEHLRWLGLSSYTWGFRGTPEASTVVVVALRGGIGAYDRAVARLQKLGVAAE